MVQIFEKLGFYYVMGKEVGEEGTPHIQGYLTSSPCGKTDGKTGKKFRWSTINALTEKLGGANPWKIDHWEKREGPHHAAAIYCMKDGDYVSNLNIAKPLVEMEREDLTEYQLALADQFICPEDAKKGRKIYWYWEKEGGWGKTMTTMYMVDKMNAVVVDGRRGDMFMAIMKRVELGIPTELVVVDIPRNRAFTDFGGLEKVKDGCFFSSKYEAGMCRFNRPHVVVFSNEPPEEGLWSKDRYVIVELKKEDGLMADGEGSDTETEDDSC